MQVKCGMDEAREALEQMRDLISTNTYGRVHQVLRRIEGELS